MIAAALIFLALGCSASETSVVGDGPGDESPKEEVVDSPSTIEPGTVAPGFATWKFAALPAPGGAADGCDRGAVCPELVPPVWDVCRFDRGADAVVLGTITAKSHFLGDCRGNAHMDLEMTVHATIGTAMPARMTVKHLVPPDRPPLAVGQTLLMSVRKMDGLDFIYGWRSLEIVPESDDAFALGSTPDVIVDLPTDFETLYREISEDLERYHSGNDDVCNREVSYAATGTELLSRWTGPVCDEAADEMRRYEERQAQDAAEAAADEAAAGTVVDDAEGN
jgi:hypothetical protein